MDSILYIREEVRNPLFDSDSLTPVVAFLSITLKVAASALATRIFDISHQTMNLIIAIAQDTLF
ncbi:hypothetical protein CsSME_00006828 [Camellia sinensis var. sinensis]